VAIAPTLERVGELWSPGVAAELGLRGGGRPFFFLVMDAMVAAWASWQWSGPRAARRAAGDLAHLALGVGVIQVWCE
jgi:hypothetical protein